MTHRARKGKTILRVCIVLILLVSAGSIALHVYNRGPVRVPTQLVRFSLTAVLCYFLFKGNKVAKFISVILITLGGALALALVFEGSPVAIASGGGMAAIYLTFAWLLLWSKSVNAFLRYQRGEPDAEPDD